MPELSPSRVQHFRGQCWRRGPSAGTWEEPASPARGESGGVQGLERGLWERSVAVGGWEDAWVSRDQSQELGARMGWKAPGRRRGCGVMSWGNLPGLPSGAERDQGLHPVTGGTEGSSTTGTAWQVETRKQRCQLQ